MISQSAPPLWLLATTEDSVGAATLPSTPELYAQHATFVWRVLTRVGVPEADREDLLQEVFVVVHRSRDGYQGRGQVTSWLYGIALRVASNHRRRVRVRGEVSSDEAEPATDPATPERAAEEQQQGEFLQRLLDALPAKKRVVFVMFELEGYSCVEIAGELGVPVGTVYSRLHEARDGFRRAYTEANADGLRDNANQTSDRAKGTGG